MTVEEARAMIARVDEAEKSGVEFTEEKMRELGYERIAGGIWQLPIPLKILKKLNDEEFDFVLCGDPERVRQ
jgi:hypothetical protein